MRFEFEPNILYAAGGDESGYSFDKPLPEKSAERLAEYHHKNITNRLLTLEPFRDAAAERVIHGGQNVTAGGGQIEEDPFTGFKLGTELVWYAASNWGNDITIMVGQRFKPRSTYVIHRRSSYDSRSSSMTYIRHRYDRSGNEYPQDPKVNTRVANRMFGTLIQHIEYESEPDMAVRPRWRI